MPPNFWGSYNIFPPLGVGSSEQRTAFLSFVALLVILELVLKGFALWRAARANQSGWFIALLIFNTAGILPLIYLLVTKPEKK